MTLQDFQASFTPILNRWKRGYSGDQLQIVYEEVKTLLKADFDRVVTNLLGTSRIQPMVPDFRKAVSDLGIRAVSPVIQNAPLNFFHKHTEDYVYHVDGNVWANNKYVFIRSAKQAFILIEEYPDHPYVQQAKAVKAERVVEIKKHISNNTYSQFHSASHQPHFSTVDYSGFLPKEPA